MSVKTFVAVAAVALGLSAGTAYAQAGSGASAPATITTPTPSGDAARTPTLGDPASPRRPRARSTRLRPVPSSQNGNTTDRASAAGGGR